MTAFDLVRANLGRNRLRTALTAGAVALATLLVCLLLTMPAGLDRLLARAASNTRLSVVNQAGLVYSLPYSLARRIRGLPGVADAMAVVWFGGSFEEAGRISFPSFAVEADRVGGVYPDYAIAENALNDFRRYRDGTLVGSATLEQYGWKIGQRITLRSNVWNVALDLRIVGEIPREGNPVVWVQREYLDQAMQAQGRGGLGTAGLIWVRAATPADVRPVLEAIDDLTRRTDSPTTAQTETNFYASFLGSLEGLLDVLLAVTLLVAVCIVFIAANTASLSIRERAAEIALLKALGFGRARLFALLLAETLVLAVLAGFAGVALAFSVSTVLQETAGRVPQLGPLGGFRVDAGVVLQGLALAVGVGVVAGVVPAWGAARRSVADALREVF
ncbi:MAG: ABC transporter permease [Myxococcales bacterium]|nr:ABC transporter permease [Myxococcales bacterium]